MKYKVLLSCIMVVVCCLQTVAMDGIRLYVRYHDGNHVVSQSAFECSSQDRVIDVNGCQWQLIVGEKSVEDDKSARDYVFTWVLKKGNASAVSFSVDFEFDRWTPDNYVFVPAIVYDGNRFNTKDIGYPPFWYDKNEWRVDMPTTVTSSQPSLGTKQEKSKAIELTSGNASTPLMAYFSERDHKAWMVQTHQGNDLGDYGLTISENENRSKASFSITAPATRTGNNADIPANVQEGDTVSIACRMYDFKAKRLSDMMNRFMDVRRTYNKHVRKEAVPYSKVWDLMNNLYQTRRWDERIDMYWLSDVGERATWNFIWQLGWVGGGQATYPLLINGSELEKDRVVRNLDAIYDRTQAQSGLFYLYGDGKEFFGFGFGQPLDDGVTFVRSQGDWLYMSLLHTELMRSRGENVKGKWLEGSRKLADAFVRVWDKYGQLGQFLDVQTGDICIGRSVAGGIVPAGLAMASKVYQNPRYLEVASQAARQYYTDYVMKGYTTGGPGEILSTPDSESAFALFESYMVLYEVTGSKEWLKYAAELLPICASWTVSYDFDFPKGSCMDKIGAHSLGSVWASVANKHSAPGICTWSGNSLLKYYRATGDNRALTLLTDIAHGLPQYVSREECLIGSMPPGGICERVNLSDWEGKEKIGGNIFASCSWCEVAAMLTVTQLPGIYVQTDKKQVAVFDNVKVDGLYYKDGRMVLNVTNPTVYPAEVSIMSETSKEARKKQLPTIMHGLKTVSLRPGETKMVYL